MITLTAIGHKQRRNRNYRRVWPVAPTSGIGTTAPVFKTQITADGTGSWAGDNGNGQLALTGATDPTKRLAFMIDTTNNIGVIQSQKYGTGAYPLALNPIGGNVGIGTINPLVPLHVASTQSYYLGTYGWLNSNGAGANYPANQSLPVSILAAGKIVAPEFAGTSDRRAKEEIRDISDEEALKFIDKSRPVHFRWRSGLRSYNFGFVAQEVDKLGFHEMVSIAPDESMKQTIDDDGYVSPAGGKLNMNYSQISAILTRAMQVIKSNVAELVVKLTGLDQRLKNAEQDNRSMRLENEKLKERADKAETAAAQTKARLDLLMKVLCAKDQDANFCH